jgi:hypothetical protein
MCIGAGACTGMCTGAGTGACIGAACVGRSHVVVFVEWFT